MKILLVESDKKTSKQIEGLFGELKKKPLPASDQEYKLTVFEDLSKGMDFLLKNSMDAVLLSLELKETKGIETFNRFYARIKEIPVIVLVDGRNERLGTCTLSRRAVSAAER